MAGHKGLHGWNQLHVIAQPSPGGDTAVYITSGYKYPDRQSFIKDTLELGGIDFSMVDFDDVPELPQQLKAHSANKVIKIPVPAASTPDAQEQALEKLLREIGAASQHTSGFSTLTVKQIGDEETVTWAVESLRSQRGVTPEGSHSEDVQARKRDAGEIQL